MDIPNIPQNLIKGLEQKNTEQLAALARVLNLVLGKTVIANVGSVEPVTPQERQQLLKQTTQALTQINKQGVNVANLTPAVKAEISRLMQQQQLIQSPELKWVNLVVNNRTITTYTDKPLAAGQTVPVQLQSPQKLVLLDFPEPTNKSLTLTSPAVLAAKNIIDNSNLLNTLGKSLGAPARGDGKGAPIPTDALTNAAANSASSKNALINNFLKIANAPLSNNFVDGDSVTDLSRTRKNELVNTLAKNTTDSSRLDKPEIKQIVADNLRQLLPYKDAPAVLYSAISQWQQLSPAHKQKLVSPSVEHALKSLAEQIRSPLQLSQPKILAQIIKNTGLLFEKKLANSLGNSANSASGKPAATGATSLSRMFNQDMKGALLNLLSRSTQELSTDKSGDKKTLTGEQTQRLLQQISAFAASGQQTPALSSTNKSDITTNLNLLMQQLMTKPAKELSDKELRTQLLTLLQQHSVHSLAKIQLQQLQSLNQEIDNKDKAQPTSSWQFDIPVKHNNEVQQLQLRIDREWIEEKREEHKGQATEKIKQWSVTLRFDLPTLGEFCAQLTVIDQSATQSSVSATLWATQEKTFAQVKQQMEILRSQLESEGILVKQLQCLKGMPPPKPMALSYSLIDVST